MGFEWSASQPSTDRISMPEDSVDLFVIGAGSGGVRAGRIAAKHGAKVVVAEEYRVGGTCVIRGCVPKKLLVYASRFADELEDAAGYGWTVPEPSFDWATLIANKDREIDRLELAYVGALERTGVAIVRSRAVLEDRHTVFLAATGQRIRARHILIATGAAPHLGPPIMGIEHVISSNQAFHLEALPKRVLVQGGGYIAVEFAAIFNGLGAQVTLVYRGENILRGFDEDLRAHLRTEMERRGIRIVTGQTVTGVAPARGALRAELSNSEEVEVDKVMFATGRHPGRARLCGYGLRQQADPGRSCRCADRGILRARSGHDRAYGGTRPRVPDQGRYLQDHVPSHEGDLGGPRHARAHEAGGRWDDRPRRGLPYRGRGCGRDGSVGRHRHEDEGDQS